jgi:hypothetical protein
MPHGSFACPLTKPYCMKTLLSRFSNGELSFRLFFVKTTWPMRLVSFCLALLMWSCHINPSLQEVSQSKVNLSTVDSKALSSVSLLPTTVSLDKVDLYLDKGAPATGSVLVEIRDSQTNTLVGSTNVPVGSIAIDRAWNTFVFTPALSLISGKKYQIHIIRSDEHNNSTGNYIFWRSSSIGVDAYPDGGPLGELDYAFKTYINGGLDQQQLSINYGSAIGNTRTAWQEFKVDYPKVSLNNIALNLIVGIETTGTLQVQIRNADGSIILSNQEVEVSLVGRFPKRTWYSFGNNTSLYRDQPYRIYVTRLDTPTGFADDYIFWTTGKITNGYPGINDVYPSQSLAYAFRTYSVIGGLDVNYGLINGAGLLISNNSYRWQEFVPRKQ